MRVRILSGNEAGCVTEVSETVGESLLATGFAERALETDATGPAVKAEAEPPAEPETADAAETAPPDTPPGE